MITNSIQKNYNAANGASNNENIEVGIDRPHDGLTRTCEWKEGRDFMVFSREALLKMGYSHDEIDKIAKNPFYLRDKDKNTDDNEKKILTQIQNLITYLIDISSFLKMVDSYSLSCREGLEQVRDQLESFLTQMKESIKGTKPIKNFLGTTSNNSE